MNTPPITAPLAPPVPEEQAHCCLCGPGPTAPYDVRDGRRFVQCRQCGLVFQSPRMEHAALLAKGALYDSAYFFTQRGRLENTSEQMREARRQLYDREYRQLLAYARGRRIFDVGCGTGRFLDFLPAEWEKHGCDISATGVALCREQYGLEHIQLGEFEALDIPPASFDVVYFRASLHHTYNPLSSLRQARRILKDDGCLVVFANCRSGLSGRLLRCGTRTVNGRVTHFFSEEDMRRLLQAAGFACHDTFAPYWGSGYEKPLDLPELLLGAAALRLARPLLARLGLTCMEHWVGPAWRKNSQFYYCRPVAQEPPHAPAA